MAGEGQMLQAAREAKQWSFTDTEEITKISVRYIQGLEEENYDVLPGATYAKGYLRTYAKQLDIDPDEIIALYNASAMPEPNPVLVPTSVVKGRPLWFRPVLIASTAVLALVLVVAIAVSQSGEKIAEEPYSPAALPSAQKAEPVTPAPSTAVVPDPATVVAPTQEGLTAQLTFTKDCWISFAIDGQASNQELFKAGTTTELNGTSKIELVKIGNAAGLTTTLNGKPLPSFQDGNKVVNNIILDQDTLKTL
ncbi:MAG TPA: RodZ domain-containing protein [Desulfosporosinus sp.]|nr:RodZ domain-containing protein [Desulfosporosinus sp.]